LQLAGKLGNKKTTDNIHVGHLRLAGAAPIFFASASQDYFEEHTTMKKHLWPGVALGFLLVSCTMVGANPVREPAEPTAFSQAIQPSPTPFSNDQRTSAESKPNGPYRDRSAVDSTNGIGARWKWLDRRSGAEILAFTSTFSAQQAASLMNSPGNSLSFAPFGRVPYYQTLTIANTASTTPLTQQPNRPVASLPEPATLLLLGTGLAALAAGLRKRNHKSDK
jgi:hypothetical protein